MLVSLVWEPSPENPSGLTVSEESDAMAEGLLKRGPPWLIQVRDQAGGHPALSLCADEARLEALNRGSDLTVQRLLPIALTGVKRGSFAGPELEKLACLIEELWRRANGS